MQRHSGLWWGLALALAGGAAQADDDELPAKYPAPGVGQGGAVGVGRVSSADTGDAGALRVGLRGGFFQGNEFPVTGTSRLLLGELTLGYTLEPGLEVFGAFRDSSASNSSGVPQLIQAQGDVLVGAKAGLALGDFRVAGDFRLDLR